MNRKPTATATSQRRTKVAANVRNFYSRAGYVTPRVALDVAHARALRAYMKRSGLGVSDAIRAAILAAGTAAKRQPANKSSVAKNRPKTRS